MRFKFLFGGLRFCTFFSFQLFEFSSTDLANIRPNISATKAMDLAEYSFEATSTSTTKGCHIKDDQKPKLSTHILVAAGLFITLAGIGISTSIFALKLSSSRKQKQRLYPTSKASAPTRKLPRRSYWTWMTLLVFVSCCFLPSCFAANESKRRNLGGNLDETQKQMRKLNHERLNLFTETNDEEINICHVKRKRRFEDIQVLESKLSRHLNKNPNDLIGTCKDNCNEICAKYASSKFAKRECPHCFEEPNKLTSTSTKSSKNSSSKSSKNSSSSPSAYPSMSPSMYPTNIPSAEQTPIPTIF